MSISPLALLFCAFALPLSLRAQAVLAPAPTPKTEKRSVDDFILLNPFEVKAEADKSYGALNSNSLTQFNAALNKTPVSADIFTEEFMRDISATSIEDMMIGYGAGTGMVSAQAPDSDALSQQPGVRVGNSTVGVRGVNSGAIHRDGFTTTGALGSTAVGVSSTFDVERVEVVRGPQGLLYGSSGAGGTINTTSKRAHFNRDNWLKGFGVGGTVALGLKYRSYYYNTPGGGRELFSSPDTWQFNAIASYRRKLGRRFGWVSQVNVENIFNHYVLGTQPSNGSGFTNSANLTVAFYGQPRMYVWTNTLSF